MYSLPDLDAIDQIDRVAQLRGAIGREFSDNYSSTCRSILLSVSKDGKTTLTREVEAWGHKPQPGTRRNPSWLTWNAIFY